MSQPSLRPSLICRLKHQAGQTTAEYALVILGAAAVAAMLIGWAARTDAIGRLFDAVLEQVLGSAS
jgi:hypothetical protein